MASGSNESVFSATRRSSGDAKRNNGAVLGVLGKPVMPAMGKVPVIRQLDLAERRFGELRLEVDRRGLCDMAMENYDCRPVPERAASWASPSWNSSLL